jgi:hypothetical protein
MRRALIGIAAVATVAIAMSALATPAVAQTTNAFCAARVSAEAAFNAGKKGPALDAIRAIQGVAPPELQDEFAVVVGKFRAKGFKAFDDPKVEAAGRVLDEYVNASCGFTPLVVTATDYAFSGIPATMPAGTYALRFRNDAPREMHELVIVRFKPGITTSVKDLVAMPQSRAEKQVTFVTATDAAPGDATDLLFVAEPGRYAAFCFVPERGKKKGAPHAMLGMTAEWTVT